jgi:hypothetical protein
VAHRAAQKAEGQLQRRLRERRGEIEEAILTRALGISDSADPLDPDYAESLRAAVAVALEYGLSVLAAEAKPSLGLPPTLLSQARLAARNGVSLDTVLRRYVSGHALLVDFIITEGAGLSSKTLKTPLRALANLLDPLLAAVAEEHGRESQRWLGSAKREETEQVERLLAGEPLDAVDLDYDLEAHHLAAIAKGPHAAEAILELAAPLDCRLLLIEREEDVVWAWFGSRDLIEPADLDLQEHAGGLPPEVCVALSEPARGLIGWRLSHRQAKAALPIALHGVSAAVRYADVALLASIHRDETLSASLRALYLEPLAEERDGGAIARETLRAYLNTDRNVSSAAALLGVSRQTVASRLRAVERKLGRPLSTSGAEIELALRLDEFECSRIPQG